MWNKLAVVITTINEKTEGIHKLIKLASKKKFKLIIVGDKKTPHFDDSNHLIFLSLKKQENLYPSISKLIPFNHYCRKNIGYLYAIHNNYEFILDTDDDNIPYDSIENLFKLNNYNFQIYNSKEHEAINIYKHFTDKHIWPRGLPLEFINRYDTNLVEKFPNEHSFNEVPIIQFLADKDPDVDAIYRLQFQENIIFNKKNSLIALGINAYCPFNSQATLFHKSIFNYIYLPCFVPFRMTDIWRSFVIQSRLKSQKKFIAFSDAIVYQNRNTHNLMKDFEDEIEGYLHNKNIIKKCSAFNWENNNLKEIYSSILSETGCFNSRELNIIEKWNDLVM